VDKKYARFEMMVTESNLPEDIKDLIQQKMGRQDMIELKDRVSNSDPSTLRWLVDSVLICAFDGCRTMWTMFGKVKEFRKTLKEAREFTDGDREFDAEMRKVEMK
jgi:hypothetical protein